MLDVLEYPCPECDAYNTLNTEGGGEPEDPVWCEACGWEGTAEDLDDH